MLQTYLPVFLFIAVAAGFAVVTILLSGRVDASGPHALNVESYQEGSGTDNDVLDRDGIRFFLMAMLFVSVDVAAVFMFPWAVSLDRLAVSGLLEMLGFLVIAVVGFFYAWKKGALD